MHGTPVSVRLAKVTAACARSLVAQSRRAESAQGLRRIHAMDWEADLSLS
jgi:hypothetical protein